MLRGATCTGPEARAGEAGAGICPPDRQGPKVGWLPDSDSERVPGKGLDSLEFNVAAEAAARAPDPRESRLGRRCAACPGPVIYCHGAKGAPTGPAVDYTHCYTVCFKLRVWSLPPGWAAAPWAFTILFRLPFLWQPETRHRRPAWPRLGPTCRSPYLQLISESLGPGMRPAAEATGTPGTRHRTPTWLRLGSASARLGSGAGGPGTGETGTRRQASHPTRPSHPALLQAPPVRRAVSTAAVRIGSRLRVTARRSQDRGNGGPEVSRTSQPGRPATRNFHHADGSRPQRAAQPA